MLTRKRVLAGVVTATAAGILFTGAPAGARPAAAGAASASAVQSAHVRTTGIMSDHHRRHYRHFRHYRHRRPYRYRHFHHYRHRRPYRYRHFRHYRPGGYRHYRHFRHYRPGGYRHYRRGGYMGFSRTSMANHNANVNLNRISTGAIVANQNNNVAIARGGGFRRWGGLGRGGW